MNIRYDAVSEVSSFRDSKGGFGSKTMNRYVTRKGFGW